MKKIGRTTRIQKKNQSGQGMVEYGLVIGLVSVWVVSIFLALRPLITEQMALSKIKQIATEGRATLIGDLNVNFPQADGSLTGGGGDY